MICRNTNQKDGVLFFYHFNFGLLTSNKLNFMLVCMHIHVQSTFSLRDAATMLQNDNDETVVNRVMFNLDQVRIEIKGMNLL